ncbi:hypothetical protein [Planosporangium mesophilum]|uniref:Uncharacterized protein n=1 Tax=Planosporangium mesophilum TaxID=689768 RepID=A0A8J3TDA6_9ACTN|nr:hypothetical protein [Planosporangium mesophilum]NJC85904.1 hypothetical protein [Planosporangium mesophilum]GII25045.1 hypothetical protein Pme01_46420 [Planosporangium mesophilum]
MRHIWTLIAAIAIGPLVWIMIAFGQERSARAVSSAQDSGVIQTGDFIQPLLLLAAAGLLLGLIGTLRFSPLGAVLTGILYAASYVGLLFEPKWLLSLFSHDLAVAGRHADPATPIRTGTTLLLGTLLLVSVVSAGRWRRWPRPAGDESAAVPERDRLPEGLEQITRPTDYETEPAPVGAGGSRWSTASSDQPDDARR